MVQVNGADVVKVGHRQVVSLIRQGGSRLLMKVVSVSRKSESNLIRKKGLLSLHVVFRDHSCLKFNHRILLNTTSPESLVRHLFFFVSIVTSSGRNYKLHIELY